ncbi:hypothetical protein ABT294_22225 [Nonomuraea sp. NPDC000554]|uniref:TRAFAC clade GTPase domain-containing protein n=1 Tax=Nonomuraea sp. NPDC000554 TaxID=3154259 RepID=UPI003331A18B
MVNTVLCPICLHEFEWSEDELFERTSAGEYRALDLADETGPRRADLLRAAHVRCPASAGQATEHHLPHAYVRHGQPLVIGLVGGPQTGKTHLLAAMIWAIERNGLSSYGLTASAVDIERHQNYLDTYVHPLMIDRKALSRTPQQDLAEFADALLISDGEHTTAVAFFDIAGESLRSTTAEATRFLPAVGGLLFVVDPSEDPNTVGDRSFGAVLDRLPRSGGRLEVPAAVVVTKCDMLRLQSPVDEWLYASGDGLDPAAILAESRDVYAFLHKRKAQPWLSPYDKCRRCTLHFASATGGAAASDGRFLREVRPRRVLEPLAALLAMTNVMSGGQEVGI